MIPARPGRGRRHSVQVVAIAALWVGASAGCGVKAESRAHVAPDDDVPFGLLAADAPPIIPPVTAAVTEPVPLCFVSDGRLVVAQDLLEPPVSLVDVVEELAVPPPEPRGLRTAIGDADLVRSVVLLGGVATVDLRGSIADIGGEDQRLAVAQLVCTLTAQPGVGQVAFTLEGAPIGVPRADGSLVTTPVSRDDYQELFA